MALPDELTPEQMAELKAQDSSAQPTQEVAAQDMPEELTPEQMAQMKAGPAMPDELTMDQMAQAKLDANLSGTHSDALAQNLQEITPASAANTMAAAGEFYSRQHGWLENAFYTLSIPEQFVARQAVDILHGASALTTEDAREILARDQVHGSDIINYYWRDPSTWYGKAGRFVTGLAADLLLDPLSYVGIGALTKGAKEATIADKTINLSKMSKSERYYYKTLQGVEKIVKSDGGVVLSEGESALDIAQRNQMAIARARDTQMGFDALQAQLVASPEAKKAMLEQVRLGMSEKSWAQEWREGSRGLTLGARVPFTDMAFEADLPGSISKLASLPVQALDGSFEFGKSLLRSTQWGDAAYNLVSDLGTRTGKLIFDVQLNNRLGSTSALREKLGEFNKNARALLVQKQKNLGTEQFSHLLNDIVDEMELGLKTPEEAASLAEQFKFSGDTSFLTKGTMADTARAQRLAAHPEVMDMIDDMREMMKDGAEAYKSRGLPFEELNPFGPNWARSYIKHSISQDFLTKFREVNDASDVMGEAMKTMPQLMGNADLSALGRKYRGTIREANASSLEKYGVKMFVDDPVELITQRMEEMNKIIQDHDLMHAATPYMVKGRNPGVGFVKYNPDHFARLSIDNADDFHRAWDSFVPKEFKTGQSIYLPEDVYDRMLFNINGWNKSKPLTKFLGAADFYTNVWRNNALFGPSYIGLNAFSNALNYLSFNDVGAPAALAKATALLTPFGKGLKISTPHLGELTGETVLKMAMEDNVLNSSFGRGIEFSKMAEHVASNRDARKTLGQKIMSVADYAFLWRYSRGMAQFADEVPKVATYISRLEKGFSRKGAAELAERYFYNFNNMSRVQSLVSKAIPFSSFPMKTAEMVLEQAKTGHLASLTIPGKVQAALDGAFVQDHEARAALDQMLPGYRSLLHPIHGELMPGMREVMIDVPWSYATIGSLFNPEDSQHPIVQLFMLAGAAKAKAEDFLGLSTEQDSEQAIEAANQNKRLMAQNIDLLIPAYMREAATLAEINGAMNFGGFFKDRYVQQMPTQSQIERSLSDRATPDQSAIMQKFTNATEFGDAMDKKYGENWLYNFVFSNRVDGGDDLISMQDSGARGEYIRRRMRQFSLGLASMNKLDSNFFMNLYAIKRQMDIKQRALKSEIQKSGELMDTERITEPEFLKRLADKRPLAKELLALDYKQDALTQYYDFFLGADKKLSAVMPGLDLIKMIVGADEYSFDYGDKPDKEVYEKLFKRKTMANTPDEEADTLIEGL